MLAVFCPGAKIAGMARVYVDRGELPDDLQALLDAGISPECTPPCDIFETSSGIEISMDLPGVSTSEIEIVFAHNVLLIAGRKLPRACDDGNAAFHVAERAFGRFARAVTVDDAFDMSRAAATLTAGELRVVLPRQPERRGRQI